MLKNINNTMSTYTIHQNPFILAPWFHKEVDRGDKTFCHDPSRYQWHDTS